MCVLYISFKAAELKRGRERGKLTTNLSCFIKRFVKVLL